jgi:acetyl esterase/lipase
LSPYIFRRKPYVVEWLPIAPGRKLRALIFTAVTKDSTDKRLRPLHLDIHGGAFIGGLPEQDAIFCELLARNTGAVVVSTTYRYAPEHTFPAAINDIDAVVSYLQKHAEDRYSADPTLMSVSGFSAGGNLAFASSQQEACHEPAKTAYKAIVTNCAVVSRQVSSI